MSPLHILFLAISLLLHHLHASAIPSPLSERTTCRTCTETLDASFDDIAAPPLGVENPLNVPPTPYKSLKYSGLVVQSQPAVSALTFHSKPNNAIVDTAQTLLGNKPAISKDYPDSKVQTFDFKSFWFGCKLASAEQGNAGPAQGCTVLVTGYKQDPKVASVCRVVTKTCTFTPPNLLSLFNVAEQQCVLDSSFDGLTNATFSVTNAQVASQLTVLYTDNYKYITHSTCCS